MSSPPSSAYSFSLDLYKNNSSLSILMAEQNQNQSQTFKNIYTRPNLQDENSSSEFNFTNTPPLRNNVIAQIPQINVERAQLFMNRQPSPRGEYFSNSIASSRIPLNASPQASQFHPHTFIQPPSPATPHPPPLSAASSLGLSPARNNSRGSIISTGSTVNSLYSSGNFSSDIEVQQVDESISEPSPAHDVSPEKKRERFKQLFKTTKTKQSEIVHDSPEDQDYFTNVSTLLNESVYAGSTKGTLNLNFDQIVEIYLFGNTIESIFPNNTQLMNYLLNSHLENGELKFYKTTPSHILSLSVSDLINYFTIILSQLDDFNEILNAYKLQEEKKKTSDFNSKETFDKLEFFANAHGITLPMAQSMFGNWLLSYAKGGTETNYTDVRIMNHFRKAARMSLILRKLNLSGYFKDLTNSSSFNKYEHIAIQRFLNKDNDFALSMALFSIAEYYQYVHGFDTSINYWECNGHVTRDVESCNMAIWGLSDGFGGGNKVKKLDKLGNGLKRNKYNTKRRIAHLTRILSKNGGQAEYGTSWVWKEKYD